MDYRALTVSEEFGSGSRGIAKIVGDSLGWKLLDCELIEAIAFASSVDNTGFVRGFDESVESWFSRMDRRAMRGAVLAGSVVPEVDSFSAPS